MKLLFWHVSLSLSKIWQETMLLRPVTEEFQHNFLGSNLVAPRIVTILIIAPKNKKFLGGCLMEWLPFSSVSLVSCDRVLNAGNLLVILTKRRIIISMI